MKMGTNAVQRGATAETVSANVKRLRTQQNLGLRALSNKLGDLGWPLSYNAIDQIERGRRRAGVDDLMALSVALDCSPISLLMPKVADQAEMVSVTGTKDWAAKLFLWLRGEASVTDASPMTVLANTLPPWLQAQWIKGGSRGDN
jgi:transcriptional regulator with XRE-family HTH domain